MYPNSDLSAGTLAIIAVVVAVCLVVWIGGVFVAAREPRRRASVTGMTSRPQGEPSTEESQRKAA